MIIYLSPEVASGLGEDTFWTWFKREIPNSRFLDAEIRIRYDDVILRYSTMGKSTFPKNTICLLWELYPEMKELLKSSEWDNRINLIMDSLKTSEKLVVSSKLMAKYYEKYGMVDILPIGVDTDLFHPLKNIDELKIKYNIPSTRKIGVWAGTTHRMKGFDQFLAYKIEHPEIFWLIIWKWEREAFPVIDEACQNYIRIPQHQMNELFNCGDFFLSTSRLHPFYMTEWEALASNLPFIIQNNVEKDFLPGQNPREQVFEYGWDRYSTKAQWVEYIEKFNREKGKRYLLSFKLNSCKVSLTTITKKIELPKLMKFATYIKRIAKAILKKNVDRVYKWANRDLSAKIDLILSEIKQSNTKNVNANTNNVNELKSYISDQQLELNYRIKTLTELTLFIERKISKLCLSEEKATPLISIICLVYKSTTFAKAVHESLYKYTTKLKTGEAELLFVANDASQNVINYLEKQKYTFVVNNNHHLSEEELFKLGYGVPEYINRVYRGYNYGIKRCRGDIVVMINSDNMFSPNWLENLLNKLEKNRIICSQIVERMHARFSIFPTAIHGEFGNHPNNFLENEFLAFVTKISKEGMKLGGAYMPCMTYKENIEKVGYYPEGNISGKSFKEIIKYGDEQLYENLRNIGIQHFTSCDSIVYHFKEGERED